MNPDARISIALAAAIVGAHDNLLRARHLAADVGNAEATLPVLDEVASHRCDLRIDEGHQRNTPIGILLVLILLVVRAWSKARDEDPHALVNLRRGQTNPLILAHRVEHVVDELLDPRGTDFSGLERPGLRAQDRMAHACDLQNRHAGIIAAALCGQMAQLDAPRAAC